MIETIVSKIQTAIESQTLQGTLAHQGMTPIGNRPIPRYYSSDEVRKGSVLILLYPDNEHLTTVFIRRADGGNHHSGQMAFAGGKQEIYDESDIATALREAEEEIGINSNDVKVIGLLTPLFISVSNFLVSPVVGYMTYKPDFKIDTKEVKEVVEISVSDLLDSNIVHTTTMNLRGNTMKVPYFNVKGNQVWGATAMMLNEFLEIIK